MEPEETQIQGSFFNKVDVPDHVHYTVVVFVFVIGTLGIMVNALVSLPSIGGFACTLCKCVLILS